MGIREHDREYLGKKISGKEQKMGYASVVGWLKAVVEVGLPSGPVVWDSTAGGTGLILGRETKIWHAQQPKNKKKKYLKNRSGRSDEQQTLTAE